MLQWQTTVTANLILSGRVETLKVAYCNPQRCRLIRKQTNLTSRSLYPLNVCEANLCFRVLLVPGKYYRRRRTKDDNGIL